MAPSASLTTVVKWNAAAIANLIKVNGPTLKVDFADTTALDSAGGVKTFIPTLVDNGEVDCEGLWDPDDTVHKAIQADATAKTSRACIVQNSDPTPSTYTCATAYIAEMTPARDLAAANKFSFKIKFSGAVVVA